MKKGVRVRVTFDNKLGTSKGPLFAHSVWWVLVEWDDGGEAIVMEQSLEVIGANR